MGLKLMGILPRSYPATASLRCESGGSESAAEVTGVLTYSNPLQLILNLQLLSF